MKTGLEKFQESLLKETNKFIDAIFNKHRDEFLEVFGNYLVDSDRPKHLKRNLSREENFVTSFFYLFAEIPRIYEFLMDIEVYIGRFPYQNTRIKKINHLRYHIEHYLNEIYIIKTRMLTLLTKLERMYKKDKRIKDIKNKLNNTKRIIEKSLHNITTNRGAHVHVYQFNTTDLKRLDTFELLSSNWSGDDVLKFEFICDFFYKFLVLHCFYLPLLL